MNDTPQANQGSVPVEGMQTSGTPAPKRSFWRYLKIILLLIGMFLLGLISGAALGVGYSMKMAVRLLSMENWAQRTIKDYRVQLKLDDVQLKTVKEIVSKYQPEIMETRNKTFRDFGSVLARMDAEIKPVLTSEQQARWEAIKKKRMEEFHRIFKLGPSKTETNKVQTSQPK